MTMPTDLTSFIPLAYLIASVCFILTLLMLVSVVATLVHKDIITFKWIVPGLIVGSLVGASMAAWIPMTKMPERIALSHCFGGLAAALVGVAEYLRHDPTHLSSVTIASLGFEA